MVYSDAGYPGGGCIFIPICQTGAYTIIHEFYPFFWENHPWGYGGSSANAFFLNWSPTYGDNVHDAFLNHDGDYNSYLANYTGYYKFALVRCPYDRMISGYKFVPSLASQAFSTVCANLPARNVNFDEHNRKNFPYKMTTKTQKHTLSTSTSYLGFDYVMRYESIQQDWDHVCDALGRSRSALDMKLSVWLDCAPVYSCDKTTYFNYTSYPNTIDTNRSNISSSFSEDFKQFGYVIGNESYPSSSIEAVWRFENSWDDETNNASNYNLTRSHTESAFVTGIPLGGGNALNTAYLDTYNTPTYGYTPNLSLDGHNFTYNLWFNCPDRSVNQGIIDYSDSYGGSVLRIYNGRLKFMVGGNNGVWTSLTSSLRIKNNTWHFVSCRHNVTSKGMKLNFDGNSYVTTSSYALQIGGYPDPDFYVGRENWGNQSNCKIDEVGVWWEYLSDQNVKVLYNNGDGRYYV